MMMNSSSFESPKSYLFGHYLKNSSLVLLRYVILSWKVSIYYINGALMILNCPPLYFLFSINKLEIWYLDFTYCTDNELMSDHTSLGLSSWSINTNKNNVTTGRSVMNALGLKVSTLCLWIVQILLHTQGRIYELKTVGANLENLHTFFLTVSANYSVYIVHLKKPWVLKHPKHPR